MAEEHPLAVFVAENQRVADAVIALLAKEGITAEAVMRPIDTSSDPLTGASEALPSTGEIDIRVTDERQLQAGKSVILKALETGAVQTAQAKREARTGTVTSICEDCGKASEWPASAMGTTEVCPHCNGYMDIPDPDDNWSDVDFGEAVDEDESEKE